MLICFLPGFLAPFFVSFLFFVSFSYPSVQFYFCDTFLSSILQCAPLPFPCPLSSILVSSFIPLHSSVPYLPFLHPYLHPTSPPCPSLCPDFFQYILLCTAWLCFILLVCCPLSFLSLLVSYFVSLHHSLCPTLCTSTVFLCHSSIFHFCVFIYALPNT